MGDQIFPKQEGKERFQSGNTPGIGSMTDELLLPALFQKTMDRCRIDRIQRSFSAGAQKAEKNTDIGGIRLDTVLRQPTFRDKVVEIEFLRCGKLWGDWRCFYSDPAVRCVLPATNTNFF